MSEVARLADLLQSTFEGTPWHGDSVQAILKGVTAAHAVQKPMPNAHSIWELVLHMAIWKDVARWRLELSERQPTDEENFPFVADTSSAAWERAKQRLVQAHRALCDAVAQMPENRLSEEIPAGGGLAHYARLHGVIHHDLYHAGQIAILKKAFA